MKVGAAIYSMLKDDSAVSALVGTRIYPELAEEGAATPYVVYSVVSNTPVDTKDSAPVDEAQLEVFSVADTYAAANDLADKVRAALSRKSKTVYKTATVQSVKYTNEVTEVSAERNMYISVQDYTVRLTPLQGAPIVGLLDSYPGAFGAYSLRKLRQDYTGAAIRVRRHIDGQKKDIGFDLDGNLDTAMLQLFAGGNTAFVEVWYDQGLQGNDIVQTNTLHQPRIVNTDNSLVTIDGQVAMRFDAVNDNVMSGDNISSQDITIIAVANATGSLVSMIDNYNDGFELFNSANTIGLFANATDLIKLETGIGTTRHLVFGAYDGSEQILSIDGTAETQAASETMDYSQPITIGQRSQNPANFLNGKVQEVIVYNSDQSANRTGIESNIMTHYSIT